MPIPGPHVHRQLISAYEQAAARLESLRAQLSQVAAQRERLEDDRSDTLTKLAKYYLPDLTPESIQQTWAEIRPTMREILLRKEHRVHELDEELKDQNTIRNGQEADLDRLNERLDQAEQRQTEVADQVEKYLQEKSEFVDLSQRASMAEVALERAEANLDEVSQDAARKLPAYDEDKLFSYLKERKFGTSEYKHRGLNRSMDRWIGKLVNYREAKRSYDYLTNTPETMRKIIAEDRLALDTVLDELQRHRNEASDRFGLLAQIRAVEALQDERKSALTQLSATGQKCESIQAELNEFEDPQCDYYQEAISVFRGMLSRTESDQLRQEARRTPEITDDQIVASLRGVESEMDRTELAASRQQDQLQMGQQVHEAIGRLVQRFRASGFDRANSQFSDSLDVTGYLDRANSPADVDDVWQSIRRSQNWGPTTMDRITKVATHPMTQVMINAMAHAAAGALSEHARRAGGRTRSRRRW
ncbi:hypothetical protein SAMN06265222_101565 [Neorhodopirellula lusitana]|uniref:Chromosome partition protein Smc n=1 Tax=Neorhodopirellula lusitana TaxID=445327 RepID=A0ABY1PPV4_9BACT|nr:hypothetical protein [Neorhodopirellula lusitana]SMP41356.1 hypothetical protein SAMN06265222_101565 [Neorhodopirellula lusitana]